MWDDWGAAGYHGSGLNAGGMQATWGSELNHVPLGHVAGWAREEIKEKEKGRAMYI